MKALVAAALALLLAVPAAARDFSAGEQAEVIRAAAALIEARYVEPDKAKVIARRAAPPRARAPRADGGRGLRARR